MTLTRYLYYATWVLPLLLFALVVGGVVDFRPATGLNAATVYAVQTLATVLMLVAMYISLKLFRFGFVRRKLSGLGVDGAMRRYLQMQRVRYIVLLTLMVLMVCLYHVLQAMSPLYCCGCLMFSLAFCYPTKDEVDEITSSTPVQQ